MKHTILGLVLVGFMLALTGCTRHYKPVSRWERSVYAAARKDVYPDDVRSAPTKYREDLLVWPGIISRANITERGDTLWADITIEHHFYDWLVDSSFKKYWLSPKGEGVFTAAWSMPKEWGLEEARKHIRPGEMVIVYGHPEGVSGATVRFGHAEYIRLIPKFFYSTSILEYGRPGEPTKHIGLF